MPPPPPPTAPPPPPPPPPKPTAACSGSGGAPTVGGAASALFDEIRQGGNDITARLRHVKDEEKAYKQNVQHGEVDFSDLELKKAAAEAKRAERGVAGSAHSAVDIEKPILTLEGDKRWVAKHHKGCAAVQKHVTLDNVTMRQAVQIHSCEYTLFEIKGKVNSVSIVACNKVQVVMDSVVSSLEVLKSEDIDVKVLRNVPTASIEKCASINLYLMDKDEAPNTDIVTACSTAVNVNFPSQEDTTEIIERPLPEQFVSKIVRDKKGGYKIETKPSEI